MPSVCSDRAHDREMETRALNNYKRWQYDWVEELFGTLELAELQCPVATYQLWSARQGVIVEPNWWPRLSPVVVLRGTKKYRAQQKNVALGFVTGVAHKSRDAVATQFNSRYKRTDPNSAVERMFKGTYRGGHCGATQSYVEQGLPDRQVLRAFPMINCIAKR